jgi:hypothetical protein
MIAGPEVSLILRSFEVEEDRTEEDATHHEDTDSHEKRFRTDLTSFKSMLDELGNPFEEENILMNVVTRQIMTKPPHQ